MSVETEEAPTPEDSGTEELPVDPDITPLPPVTTLVDPIDAYKMVVKNITEQANDPEFRAKFREYLKAINPDEDDHVTSDEIANVVKQTIVQNTEKLNAQLKGALDNGMDPEELYNHLNELGSPIAGNTGTLADFSPSAALEKIAQECSENKDKPLDDPNAKIFQEIVANYPQIVTALQLRSTFIGDVFLSDETKALTPKLNPADAYSLPLFISMPSQERICQVIKESAEEVAITDPLRPLDTPKVPDTTPEQDKSR